MNIIHELIAAWARRLAGSSPTTQELNETPTFEDARFMHFEDEQPAVAH
jgi:hypothetical protein